MVMVWKRIKRSKLGQSMLKNLLLKPISYLLNIIYTPLLLSYLGDAKYGLWATILSIISWINLCDIGIGNGLRNILTSELAGNKLEEARKSVSTAYIVLSSISLAITIVLVIVSISLNWKKVLNIDFDITWVMAISFAGIAVNFVLGLGKIVLYVLQESERIPILNLSASIIQVLGILFLKQYTEADLLYVALLFGLSSSVVYLLYDIRLAKRYYYCQISFLYFDKNKVRLLFNTGFVFLFLQLGGIALTSTDNVLISNLFGTEAVTPYNSVTRLFCAIEALYIALIAPIWTRTAVAREQNDYAWIESMTKKLIGVVGVLGIALFVISFFYEDIAEIWLRKRLVYENGLIFCTVLCTLFEMIVATLSSILNGLNILKPQAVAVAITVPLNIPCSIILATNFGLGTTGIKLATLMQLMLSSAWYLEIIYHEIRKKAGGM